MQRSPLTTRKKRNRLCPTVFIKSWIKWFKVFALDNVFVKRLHTMSKADEAIASTSLNGYNLFRLYSRVLISIYQRNPSKSFQKTPIPQGNYMYWKLKLKKDLLFYLLSKLTGENEVLKERAKQYWWNYIPLMNYRLYKGCLISKTKEIFIQPE